jgi:hypothetical protein
LLSEIFKSVTKEQQQKQNKKSNKPEKNQPASWSLTLTWLVGFKP